MDDDDEWFPEKIEKQLEIFENSKNKNIGIVACNALDIFEDLKTAKEYKIKEVKEEKYLPMILNGCFIHSSSSVVVRKKAFKEVGYFDEKLKTADDWDMWIRILSKYNFDFYPSPLFNYYVHGKNISWNISLSLKIEQWSEILEKHKETYLKHPVAYHKKLIKIIKLLLLNKNSKEAKLFIVKAIKIKPFYIMSYFYLFFTFTGDFYKKLIVFKRKITGNPNTEIKR